MISPKEKGGKVGNQGNEEGKEGKSQGRTAGEIIKLKSFLETESLCSPGCPGWYQTQRFPPTHLLFLLSAGTKGMGHHHLVKIKI